MKAEELLRRYARVADAPDAISRLRRFVLDLAVRGKLVPQSSIDEPTRSLVARIDSRRLAKVSAGTAKAGPELPAVAAHEAPFNIPPTWGWVRFASIAGFGAGRTPSRNDTSYWDSKDHPWVSIADMVEGAVLTSTKESVSEKARRIVFGSDPEGPNTIIMSFKLTIGKISRLGVQAFHNEAIIAIKPYLEELDPYLFKVLPKFAQLGDTKGAIKGATLNRGSISNILIPLPPLSEQHRIVAKVDELMAQLGALEKSQEEVRALKGRLLKVLVHTALEDDKS